MDVKKEAEDDLYKALKEAEFAIKLRQSIILDNGSQIFMRKKMGNIPQSRLGSIQSKH